MQVITYNKYEPEDHQVKLEKIESISNDDFRTLVGDVVRRIQKNPDNDPSVVNTIKTGLNLCGPEKIKSFDDITQKSTQIYFMESRSLSLDVEEHLTSFIHRRSDKCSDSISYYVQINPPARCIDLFDKIKKAKESKNRKSQAERKAKAIERAKKLLEKEKVKV